MPSNNNWYASVSPAEPLSQGDIVLNCPVTGWTGEPVDLALGTGPEEELLARVQLMSADLIVMTQACDLEHSHVQDVILCPHQTLIEYRAAFENKLREKGHNPSAKAWSSHCDDIKDGFVWNLVLLNSGAVDDLRTEHRVVDCHYIYTVPRSFVESLLLTRGTNRLRLMSPYLESVSQSFARYFMRIGLPTPVSRAWA
jgi:hypothetical protein